jgi:hypothetical protein
MGAGMDELSRALGDISSIRRQMAGSMEFRGYGPATLACTSLFAVTAACAQAIWVPSPASNVPGYLGVWSTTAVAAAALTGIQVYRRSQRMHSGLSNEMIRMAAAQFFPALGAGFLLMVVVATYLPAQLWLLPGLWQVVFSLGVFASCRFLPRAIVAAGCWYLVSGLISLHFGDNRALSPWTMGLAFGAGQMLVAAILLFTAQENQHE